MNKIETTIAINNQTAMAFITGGFRLVIFVIVVWKFLNH